MAGRGRERQPREPPMTPVHGEDGDASFLAALIGDGRPLLSLTALALILSGVFALFLSATGSFLPHDVAFLGMEPQELCAVNQCRVVHFMFHDRVAFGGVLIAIGTLYLWLAAFPLRAGQEWAWWIFALSGASGFASFLAYLGYGYLDTWHGAATLALLPCFLAGMWKTRAMLLRAHPTRGIRLLLSPAPVSMLSARQRIGRICLLLAGLGKIGAGAVVMAVGMTSIFVPQDTEYLGLTPAALHEINPRLVPLIAHDRAGFGGGLLSCGVIVWLAVWKAPMTRSFWQALLIAGGIGFGCAIGVHYPIGYRNIVHLAPAWIGAIIFLTGMICSFPRRRHA